MNSKNLTTTQAANRAGVSRPTISRALKNAEIQAIRDNSGRWIITPEAVDAWKDDRATVHTVQRSNSVHSAPEVAENEQIERLKADIAATREAMARLEGEAAMNKERLADLGADRDQWRQMAERLSDRKTNIGFWNRFFGKG